jgi:hypothetical protein
MINLQGDIALSSTSGSQPYGIYTADNRYVKIPSLIHPDDAGIAPSYARMVGIAQRDLTGLPPAIVTEFLGTNEGGSLIQRGYYLLPVPAGG